MAEFDWQHLRVLILDGDNGFAVWAQDLLTGRGAAEVRSTASAADGFHMLGAYPADVVLVEAKMPDVSGVDFVRWVRNPRYSPNPELPLVLTTARPEAATLRQACEIGIESFMQKPIEAEKFLRRLAITVRQPRRFVIGGTYFGPDRRRLQQPFEGADRRISRVMQGESTHAAREPAPDPMWAAAQTQQDVVPTLIPGTEAAAVAPQTPGSDAADHTQGSGDEAPQVGAATRRRPAAPPPLAPRPKGREWQDEPADKVEAGGRRRSNFPLVDTEAAKRDKAREAERWKRLLGDDGKPAEEGPLELEPILLDHGVWLNSKGREGKRAVLNGADLSGADLNGAKLANADLQDAIMSGAACRETDFQGADMRRVNLASADVTSGNLGVAKLRHADMRRTKLDGANLRGTDLAGANLRGASLNEADLGGANLLSTDLRETDLSGTRGLTQSQIAKVRADSSTRLPPGLRLPRQEG